MARFDLIRNEHPDAKLPNAPSQYVILLRECVLDADKTPLLTQRCANLQELDTEIDAIKAKLDEIKKEAHFRWG